MHYKYDRIINLCFLIRYGMIHHIIFGMKNRTWFGPTEILPYYIYLLERDNASRNFWFISHKIISKLLQLECQQQYIEHWTYREIFNLKFWHDAKKNDVPVKGSRISTRKSTRKGRNLPSNQLFAGEIKDCSLWISHRINSCARLAEFGVLLGGGEFLRLWLLTVDRNTNETIGMFRRTLMSAKNRSFLALLFHASHNSKKRTFVNQSNHKYPTLHYSNNNSKQTTNPTINQHADQNRNCPNVKHELYRSPDSRHNDHQGHARNGQPNFKTCCS